MRRNKHRGTPGMLLLLWAGIMPMVVLFAWRVHAHRAEFEWVDYPTGLGDNLYYSALGKNDLYEGNLKFPGTKVGLYRRSRDPLTLPDELMLKTAKENQVGYFVYQQKPEEEPKPAPKRYFLKSADDLYVEFGERLHWPAYQPPKLVP